MVATLNQPQYQPWPLEEQVIAIFAGIQGLLDDIPPGRAIRDEKDSPTSAQDEARKAIEEVEELRRPRGGRAGGRPPN